MSEEKQRENAISDQGSTQAATQPEQHHETEPSATHPVLHSEGGERHRRDEEEHNGNNRFWQEWNTTEKFTFWLVVFTGLYTVISFWQGCQTRDAVNVARDTLITSNRPWVGVGGTKPMGEMIPGEPFRVRIRFKNVGNSPGLYVDTQAHFSPLIGARGVMMKVPFMDLSILPACIRPKPQWGERTSGSFLMPGDEPVSMEQSTPDPMNETTIKFAKGKEDDDPVISPEEFAQFPIFFRIEPKDLDDPNIRKKVGLYLVGCINYFDGFKVPHRTNFCFRYEHATEEKDRFFSMCEYGHDAD